MALAGIFNFFMPVSMMVDPNCDYYQNLIIGQNYYIYNKQYPLNYGPGTACKWVAKSDTGTRIVITCEDITIPSSSDCSGDRLSISLSGNEAFTDSNNYCGSGQVTLVSDGNALAVGLFTTRNTGGGRFACTLTAIIQNDTSTTTHPPSLCECGWKQETRIVGGVETGVNEYPAMAGILDFAQKRVYCGGTIIAERYVVSAAHCFVNKSISGIGVLVGDHDVSTGADTASAALYPISAYEIHPGYDSTTNANDIVLVQTKTPMNFSIHVGPACLPFRFTNLDFSGQVVTALGWGLLEFSGQAPDKLQKVNLTVIPNSECVDKHSEPITASNMCTYTKGKDACQSDSGGPLFWTDPSTRRLQLVGIISFGRACATTIPGVNARVTSYLSWIASRTSDTTYCIK